MRSKRTHDDVEKTGSIVSSKLNPYEQQREDRIKRNTEVLLQMGILTAALAYKEAVIRSTGHAASDKASKRKKCTPSEPRVSAEPTRRSSRLRGDAAALPAMPCPEAHRHGSAPSVACQTLRSMCLAALWLHALPSAHAFQSAHADQVLRKQRLPGHRRVRSVPTTTQLDEHNLYRIRTMSEKALQRRIHTIQRCDKLQSFTQVLISECG